MTLGTIYQAEGMSWWSTIGEAGGNVGGDRVNWHNECDLGGIPFVRTQRIFLGLSL